MSAAPAEKIHWLKLCDLSHLHKNKSVRGHHPTPTESVVPVWLKLYPEKLTSNDSITVPYQDVL